jgi:predicted RNase H-like HicB family nuclease
LSFSSVFIIIRKETAGILMENQYRAIIKKDGSWWVGWIEEVPGVNCQEKTREKLLESLRITLKEALSMNRRDAIAAAGDDFQEEKIAL